MASIENVEIVRRAFRDAESNEYEASAEFLHEDFEMGMLPDWPGATSPDMARGRRHDGGVEVLVR